MKDPINQYWNKRLADLKAALESNNFDVHIADNHEQAHKIVEDEIIPALHPKTVLWGGSLTVIASGLYDKLKKDTDLEMIDTLDAKITFEEMIERRRQALLADLFITGTNAVTETGQLVNLDMIGNRIGGLTFGPKWVILLIGRNKLVPNLDDAMYRVKNFVAPVNSMRLGKKTPCVKTSYCEECKSPDRICNTWTITEKSFPKGRIKIVLINEDLGF